jgi:hypothetical protein
MKMRTLIIAGALIGSATSFASAMNADMMQTKLTSWDKGHGMGYNQGGNYGKPTPLAPVAKPVTAKPVVATPVAKPAVVIAKPVVATPVAVAKPVVAAPVAHPPAAFGRPASAFKSCADDPAQIVCRGTDQYDSIDPEMKN